MMTRDTATLETLDRRMAELAGFVSPSEIFRSLLEGTVVGAPRAAIFLMRDGLFRGWNSLGYPANAAQSQRRTTLPSESGWLSSLASEDDVRWRTLAAGESAPDFGQSPAAEAVGLPVRVGGKTVAVVIAERHPDEEPWSPAALAILCQAARLRLELDLAWRRLKAHNVPAGAAAPARHPVRAASTESHAGAVAPVAGPSPAIATELAPFAEVAAATVDAEPRHEEARRYARLVATDIRLYNEEAVVFGRKERDLSRRLGEQLTRGREAFVHRFPDLGPEGMKLLDDAYVQVLAGGDSSLI